MSLIAAALALSACEHSSGEPPEPPSERVTLMWTGTIEGAVEECDCPLVPGGLARLASLVATQRETAAPISVLIDLGDVAGDPTEEDDVAVEPQVARRVRATLAREIMGEIGYDLYVPGERDLTLGAQPLVEAIAAEGGELLATNLRWAEGETPLGKEVEWIETDYGDIALLSVVVPLDEGQLLAARRGHDPPIEVLDPATALTAALETVTERASLVVLLAHGPTEWAKELLAGVSGVDLCLVAHDHENPTVIEEVGGALLLRTAGHGKSLGRLDIELRADGTLSYSGNVFAPNGEVDPASPIQAMVDELPARLTEAEQRLLDRSRPLPPNGGTYLGFTNCGQCHLSEIERWYETAHLTAFRNIQLIGYDTVGECLECHSTGSSYQSGFETQAITPNLAGVTCEACHGPAGEGRHDQDGYGRADETTCLACHDSVHDPEFDFDERFAAIRHTLSAR